MRAKSNAPNHSILIAVSTTSTQPWKNIFEKGCCETWIKDRPIKSNQIKVLPFKANNGNQLGEKYFELRTKLQWSYGRFVALILKFIDVILFAPFIFYIPKYKLVYDPQIKLEILNINIVNGYASFRWRLLSLIKYFVEETEFEYLLTTTVSSYIDIETLGAQIAKSEFDYGGTFLTAKNTFASGANRLLSRKAAKELLKNRSHWSISTVEDVGLGRFFESTTFNKREFDTILVDSENIEKSVTVGIKNEIYHYRVKSGTNKERLDVNIMLALDQEIKKYRKKN